MADGSCRMRVLADRPGCRVDLCEHGHLHVNLGAVCLRLRPREFEALRLTLNEAALDTRPTENAEPRERSDRLH